jgi:anti-anti-sigma regulatory factor
MLMSTSPIVSLSGRVDVHRLDELRALGPNPMIDASGIEFLDLHALSVLYELGAIIFSPSEVVRITIELTNSPLASFPTVGAAVGTPVRAE